MKQNTKPTLIDDRTFPFECSVSYGVEPEYQKLHWHQEMEICYIRSGTGKYLINGRNFSFAAGDIFLMNNDEIHMCYDDKDMVMLVIMFDPSLLWSGFSHLLDYEYLRPFLEKGDYFCNKLDGTAQITPRLAAILNEIEQEYLAEQRGFELMIKSLLLRFLTLIIRNFTGIVLDKPVHRISKNAKEKVKSVMDYAEAHYQEPLTLESLAQLHQISPAYLCSIFKSLTGLSPMDFIIRRRISAAKQYLSGTNESVLEIAALCGFRSLSNFNHLFKALVGCSPRQYRNGFDVI